MRFRPMFNFLFKRLLEAYSDRQHKILKPLKGLFPKGQYYNIPFNI